MTQFGTRTRSPCLARIPRLLGVLAAALLCGCASYWRSDVVRGTALDAKAIQRIIVGKTTRDDVFRLLGPPRSILYSQAEFEHSTSVQLGPGQRTFYSVTENRYVGGSAMTTM